MFGKTKNPDALDALYAPLYKEMKEYGPLTSEYEACLGYLERVDALKENKKPSRVSRDTILTVAGHLAGILLIVAYEQKHVMTSQAFGGNIALKKTQK